jgi:hypothetical protein
METNEVDLSESTMQRLVDLFREAMVDAFEAALARTGVTVESLALQAIQDVQAAVADGVSSALGSTLSVTIADLDMQAINDVKMAIELADVADGVSSALGSTLSVTIADLDMQAINDVKMAIELAD